VAGAACLRQKEAGGELLDLWGALGCRSPGSAGASWPRGGARSPSAIRMARNPLRSNEPTL
jgi:hypothetical protein